MIDSLIGWKRSSVVQITGPLPAAGGLADAVQLAWLGAAGCACPAGASWAAEADAKANAGSAESAKAMKIRDITEYKPVWRCRNKP